METGNESYRFLHSSMAAQPLLNPSSLDVSSPDIFAARSSPRLFVSSLSQSQFDAPIANDDGVNCILHSIVRKINWTIVAGLFPQQTPHGASLGAVLDRKRHNARAGKGQCGLRRRMPSVRSTQYEIGQRNAFDIRLPNCLCNNVEDAVES